MNHNDLPDIERCIGGKLRDCREAHGLTQRQVADILGVSFQQLNNYERGVTRISSGKLLLLSVVLNVPIASFFGFDFEKKSEGFDRHFRYSDEYQIINTFKSIKDPALKKKVAELCALIAKDDD